jgi:hypothetical protein
LNAPSVAIPSLDSQANFPWPAQHVTCGLLSIRRSPPSTEAHDEAAVLPTASILWLLSPLHRCRDLLTRPPGLADEKSAENVSLCGDSASCYAILLATRRNRAPRPWLNHTDLGSLSPCAGTSIYWMHAYRYLI